MGKNRRSLVGTWQLIHTECVADNGDQLPPPYSGEQAMGLVSFSDNGRMIRVLCDGRANLPANTSREYTSYCGQYQYDGKQLITRVDCSANTAWVGSDQIRDVFFEDETMILHPVRAPGSSGGQRVLQWRRMPEASVD